MKVLVSPGYGAGWSTWNDPRMAFDKRLVEAFERGISIDDMEELCINIGYDEPYMGGFNRLEVREIPSGAIFQIREYDGNEYIEVFDEDEWYIAEGEYYDID